MTTTDVEIAIGATGLLQTFNAYPVTVVPPAGGALSSQLPPSAAIRCRMDANPCDGIVARRAGNIPLPSSEIRMTNRSC